MKVNFIEDNCNIVNDGKFNMDFDLKTLNYAIENKIDYALIRFYQWYPRCISLGRNQKNDIDIKDIDIVQRVSGGRALLHDKELTYSVVCPIFEQSVIESYKIISTGLIEGFKNLNIDLSIGCTEHTNSSYCMNVTSRADITFDNKKFIGSAQYRKQGYILQHGSIPYELDWELIQKIFKEHPKKNSIITLNEIKDDLSTRQIINALKTGFEKVFDKII